MKEGNVSIWNTIPKLKEFLGDIDTKTEALIYIMANGFPLIPNDTVNTGVMEDKGCFIIRVMREDSICSPIITNRYTLSLDKYGKIDTLEIKEVGRDPKGCI